VKALERFSLANTLFEKMVSPLCKQYSLTQMEYYILCFLMEHPDKNTAADIVKMRDLTKSHVSISVRSLQEKGLLIGEYRDGNRKTVWLRMTDQALQIAEQAVTTRKEFLQVLFAGFSEEEFDIFRKFIYRIEDNITVRLEQDRQ